MSCTRKPVCRAAAALLFLIPLLPAQTVKGTVERIKVHAKTLEGNLEGDSPDRDVTVYLPPSYQQAQSRRYPVVYMLHGYTDSDDKWMGLTKHWINLPEVLDKAMPAGKEMILVMPNAYTRYHGSMYSNSVTTGNWEDFVSSELVAYIDGHYRTRANLASRGLAGHSMGGYGTLRIGMKHPDVFSSLYALSPCCLAPPESGQAAMMARAEAVKSFAEIDKSDFMVKAQFASAAAWSPDPTAPPLYVALPVRNGEYLPAIAARWAANAPLAFLDQFIGNLRRLKALAFDAGDEDRQIAATIRELDQRLSVYQLKHDFEIYPGNHINHVADRISAKMLPFFAANLAF